MFKNKQETLKFILTHTFIFLIGCGTWVGNQSEEPAEDPGQDPVGTNPGGVNPAGELGYVNLSIVGNVEQNLTSRTIPVINKNGNPAGSISLQFAKIIIKEIKIKKDSETSDKESDFEGPYIVDLINNTTAPEPGLATVEAGIFKDIELKMEKLDPDELDLPEDDPMSGKSIYFEGIYTNENELSKNITLTMEFGEEFSIAEIQGKDKGIEVKKGETIDVNLVFQLEKWFDFSNPEINDEMIDFSDINLADIVLSEDSDDEYEKELFDIIKESIKHSTDYEEEDDDDD